MHAGLLTTGVGTVCGPLRGASGPPLSAAAQFTLPAFGRGTWLPCTEPRPCRSPPVGLWTMTMLFAPPPPASEAGARLEHGLPRATRSAAGADCAAADPLPTRTALAAASAATNATRAAACSNCVACLRIRRQGAQAACRLACEHGRDA